MPRKSASSAPSSCAPSNAAGSGSNGERQFLEVDESARSRVDVANIVSDAEKDKAAKSRPMDSLRARIEPRANDPDFVDDDDVPPLG